MPDVGDDRWGVLTMFTEAGDWAEWRLHSGLIRDNAVLAMIPIIDMRADTEPYYTIVLLADGTERDTVRSRLSPAAASSSGGPAVAASSPK